MGNRKTIKLQVTGHLSTETYDKFTEAYEVARQASTGKLLKQDFIEMIFNSYFSNPQVSNENVDSLNNEIKTLKFSINHKEGIIAQNETQITNLTNEIGRLKTNNTLVIEKEAEIEKIKISHNSVVNQLNEKIAELEQKQGIPPSYVALDELTIAILNKVSINETKRTSRQITPEMIITKMVTEYNIKGITYFYPHLTGSELKEIKLNLQ